MKKFKVTQTREIEVEAGNVQAAQSIATKAFYGNRATKSDPAGAILSAVQVTDMTTEEV